MAMRDGYLDRESSDDEVLPEDRDNDEYKPTTIVDSISEYFADCWRYFRNKFNITLCADENWYFDLKGNARWLSDKATIQISMDDVMLMMTIFVLFGINIELITLPDSADSPFAVALTICMFAFIFELLLNSWSKSTFRMSLFPPSFTCNGYMFSFFWWFDLLAILSLWPDIPWISNPLHLNILATANDTSGNYTNAGRVVRLVRLVRFVRLYRLILERRRAQQYEEMLQELCDADELDSAEAEKLKLLHLNRESKLGSQLSTVIIQYLIVAILLMLLIVPLLSYTPVDNGPKYGLSFVHRMNTNESINNASKFAVVNEFISIMEAGPIESPASILVSLIVQPLYPSYVLYDKYRINNLRDGSNFKLAFTDENLYTTEGIFDDRQILYTISLYSIILTILVAFLLLLGYVIFTTDIKRLVLAPIERMMNMVELVARDPLQPLQTNKAITEKPQAGQYETDVLESSLEKVTSLLRVSFGEAGAGIIRANLDIESSSSAVINALIPGIRIYAIFGFCDIHHFEEINQVLDRDVLTFVNTIAEIVHSSVHTWDGQCNKNLGNAFVVVWRIGDEVSLTSALQSTAMAIGHNNAASQRDSRPEMSQRGRSVRPSTTSIISGRSELSSKHHDRASQDDDRGSMKSARSMKSHNYSTMDMKSVDENSEMGKSRSGRALSDTGSSSTTGHKKASNMFKIDLNKIPGVDRLADSALISYLKIIAEINRSILVLNYREDPRLKFHKNHAKMLPTTPRTPHSPHLHSVASGDFKVRMGFGLHAGWGIEGAVGSIHKVDATYLSPHVNMAARLETASKQYQVPLLMSHIFHDLLSEVFQKKCRQIDKVTVKGSSIPIGIFTYDCLQDQEFTKRTRSDYLLYMGIKKRSGRGSTTSGRGSMNDLSFQDDSLYNLDSSIHSTSSKKRSPQNIENISSMLVNKVSSAYLLEDESIEFSEKGIMLNYESMQLKSTSEIEIPTPRPMSPKSLSQDSIGSNDPLRASPERLSPMNDFAEADDMMGISSRRLNSMAMFKPASNKLAYSPRNISPTTSPKIDSLSEKKILLVDTTNSIPMDEPEKKSIQVDKVSSQPIEESHSSKRDSLSLLFPEIKDIGETSPPNQRPLDSRRSFSSSRRNSLLTRILSDKSITYNEPMDSSVRRSSDDFKIEIETEDETERIPFASIATPVLMLPSGLTSRAESPMPFMQDALSAIPLYFMTPEDSTEEILENDTDLVKLRRHVTEEFIEKFNEGYRLYTQGDWRKARKAFEESDEIMAKNAPSLGGDGPSQTLLNYMSNLNYQAPANWHGFRALTNK